MVTNGNENYDGFTSLECTPHNITNDIHLLPEIFREGYSNFRVVIYDNCLMHLEGILNRQKSPIKIIHIAEILNSSI